MPKIAKIDTICLDYAIAPEKAYGTARGLNFRRQSALVEITTDDGVTGYGEGLGPVQAVRTYIDLIRSFFIGRSLYDFEFAAAYCHNRLYHFGEGHFISALSALNVACFDAMGRTLGVPVHDLIGGKAMDKIPCYATTGYITKGGRSSEGLSQLEEQLSRVDKSRFAGVKIKVGLDPRSDVERVRLARRILGDDIRLMVDVNGNYTVDTALQSLRAIEPFDIHWCEEPLPTHDIQGHVELRARSPIPIATGEGLSNVAEFKHLADARGIDVVQPAIGRCGGLSAARTIAAIAATNNLRVAPAVWGGAFGLAAGMHFMTSMPVMPHTDNVPFPVLLEYDIADNPLRDDVVRETLWPEQGGVRIPPGPGLGLTLDLERAGKYLVKA